MTEHNQARNLVATLRDALQQLELTLSLRGVVWTGWRARRSASGTA